jgi:hypothetical protein
MADSTWRTLPDPHLPNYQWRCCNLVLEFQYIGKEYGIGDWLRPRGDIGRSLSATTPERKALWLNLFLYPCA